MAEPSPTQGGFAEAVQAYFRRHWQRALVIRQWLRLSEDAQHLLMAAAVGVAGGLTNWLFYLANQGLQWVALGQAGDLLLAAERLPPGWRVAAPALGGLAAGATLYLGLRLITSPGLTNLLEVVVAGDGRLSLRRALVNAASSLMSFSTGASLGREGTIIQLSATWASKLGQLSRWPPYRLRLMVACGAAAGMSAAYNAPLAGAVFAAQIVLGNFSMNLFAPLVCASVVATMISRGFFGVERWYEVPTFDFTSLTQLPWFIPLGILSGLVGAAFLKALRWSAETWNRMHWPFYLRLAASGLIVGAIAIWYPEVYGNGYAATNRLLHQITPALEGFPTNEVLLSLQFIVGLLLAKFLATIMTVGSGAVGGVFTPTLFLGACLGSLFGSVLHLLHVAESLPTGAFALVGMGSMLAATTQSPLLAFLMIFELSLNYSVMPPLMLACVFATLVARRLEPESVYTEPLRRKGVQLRRESLRLGAATETTVGDLMRPPVPPLRLDTPFPEIANRFLRLTHNFLPVVDDQQRLQGLVALQDLKEYLNAGQELNSVIAYDIMRPRPPCLTPDQKLIDALPVLLMSEQRNVPVVNNLRDYRLVGTVSRTEALGLVSEAIASRSALKE